MERRAALRPPPEARALVLTVSPKSGRRSGDTAAQAIATELTADGYRVHRAADLADLSRIATELHSTGELRAVIACGGDGTAALVRNHTPLEVPLVLVPMGTENLLANYLGQTAIPAAVLETIDRGVTAGLDLGVARSSMGRHYFHLMASAGFDAEVVRRLHDRRSGHITRLAYARPFLESIRSYEYPELRLYCDDDLPGRSEPIPCRWATGFNLPLYARGWKLAPDAVGTDGLFDVCVFQRGSLFHGARYLWHVLRGSHLQLADVRIIRCRRFRVETMGTPETAFQVDGDYGGLVPLEAEILPGMLRVMVMPNVAERLGFELIRG